MASIRELITWFLIAVVTFLHVEARRVKPNFRPKLPYCLDKQTKSILLNRKGTGRTKRAVSWPYNCNRASVLRYQGRYNHIKPIETCCKLCNFPEFKKCQSTYGNHWICSTNGLHCIAKCIRLHDPNLSGRNYKKIHRARKIGGRLINPKCGRKVVRNGKPCIERLCIPIRIYKG